MDNHPTDGFTRRAMMLLAHSNLLFGDKSVPLKDLEYVAAMSEDRWAAAVRRQYDKATPAQRANLMANIEAAKELEQPLLELEAAVRKTDLAEIAAWAWQLEDKAFKAGWIVL